MRLYDWVFYAAASFILGVGLASLNANILSLALLFVVAILINLYVKESWVWLGFAGIMAAGFFYYHFYSAYSTQNIPYDRKLEISAVVASDPTRGLKAQDFRAELDYPYGGKVRVYAELYPELDYGDRVELSGTIKKNLNGPGAVMSFPKITYLSAGHGSELRSKLYAVKNILISNIERVLSGDKAALASGILLGDQSRFRDELKEAMKTSGTTHIVALSGYNISIIAVLVSSMLAYLMPKRRAFYITIFVIVSFVLMTGAEESVVRAAFMGIIAMIAEQSSRPYSVRNAVTLTALAMILFDPTVLVWNAGFQLSFLALLGLVYIEPQLRRLFKIKKGENISSWKRNLLQTASAQIAVAPVALYTFGYLSPVALISNVLILEFIPITMFLVFIAAMLGFVFQPLAQIVGWVTSIFLGYEIFIIELFGSSWI